MTNKQKILFKMLEKDDFDFIHPEGRFYKDIYDLLEEKMDDIYDLFELGQNNPDFEGGSFFYYYNEEKIVPMNISELLSFDIKKFLEYYKKEYGEDTLYKKFHQLGANND